jgi:FkbM family methyltransferase
VGFQERLALRLPPAVKLWLKRRTGCPDIRLTLANLRRSGFTPSTVIDVGAYDGSWARGVARIWPDARYVLFEPNPAMRERCVAFCGSRHLFFDCAVSDFAGSAPFAVEGSNSHLGTVGGVRVAVQTLDAALHDVRLEPPMLLKIDVQGEESKVLAGARGRVLPQVGVLVVELSLIPLHPGALGLREAIEELARTGFRLADLSTFWRRPVDGALWQVDAVFVRDAMAYGAPHLGY